MAATAEPEYVLGTGRDELERLGLQHRLWSDAAHALWKRAGIRPGQAVLDVGCGPGYAAFDLAELVQAKGRVLGVDESPSFVAHVNAQARARGSSQLAARAADVQRLGELDLTAGSFDLAYARWVLCFVERPEDVVAGVARLLRPGGRFAIHDYFNYRAMTVAPRRASYAKVVEATERAWRGRGGDPDVVGRLPGLLADAGFFLEHLEARQGIARRGESLWAWVDTWWRTFVPKLVEMGGITPDDARAFFADWDALRPDRDFALLPCVYEIVAVRA